MGKLLLRGPGLLVYPPPPNIVQGPRDFCNQIGKSSVTDAPRSAGPTGMKTWGKKATCGPHPLSASSIKRYLTPPPKSSHTWPTPPGPGLGVSGKDHVSCVSLKAP